MKPEIERKEAERVDFRYIDVGKQFKMDGAIWLKRNSMEGVCISGNTHRDLGDIVRFAKEAPVVPVEMTKIEYKTRDIQNE